MPPLPLHSHAVPSCAAPHPTPHPTLPRRPTPTQGHANQAIASASLLGTASYVACCITEPTYSPQPAAARASLTGCSWRCRPAPRPRPLPRPPRPARRPRRRYSRPGGGAVQGQDMLCISEEQGALESEKRRTRTRRLGRWLNGAWGLGDVGRPPAPRPSGREGGAVPKARWEVGRHNEVAFCGSSGAHYNR